MRGDGHETAAEYPPAAAGAGRDRPDARPAAGGFPAEPHRGPGARHSEHAGK